MKISVEWANSLIDKPLSVREMAAALELAGIEVEAVGGDQDYDERIVVGRVLQVADHPNADKLKLTQVDVKSTTLSIICGASNVATGQQVAVAQAGSVLPGGTKIIAATIRGQKSQGMLCSEAELGISQNHDGIMILGEKAALGAPIKDIITTDAVIDVTTPANRWDLNGIVGVVREVSAQIGVKSTFEAPELQNGSERRPTAVSRPELGSTSAYLLARLKVAGAGSSPPWLQRRLRSSGIRPISPAVDVTNYVLMLLGQPLHAFDAAKVAGAVGVRRARQGEKLTTLDGTDRDLDPTDLVIADDTQVIGLAGVMGGKGSEITAATTEILLESASFDPALIRKTAIRHGLRTDASARFERGLPPRACATGLAVAVQLLEELAGAELVEPAGVWEDDEQASHGAGAHTAVIAVSPPRVSALLGLELTRQQIAAELAKLGFACQDAPDAAATAGDRSAAEGSLAVAPPWWRPDVTMEADIAEEVIKLVGYDRLPATLPAWRPERARFDNVWAPLWRAKAALRSLGLFEVTTYSFISKNQIEELGVGLEHFLQVKNPLSREQEYLRSMLLPSLLQVALRNRTYAREFGLFELSKLYLPRGVGELPAEPTYLGVLVRRERDGYRAAKAALDRLSTEFNLEPEFTAVAKFLPGVMHPARTVGIRLEGNPVGFITELHPALLAAHKLGGSVGYLEIDWLAIKNYARPKQYQARSRFPDIQRDIAIVVDRSVTWQRVREVTVAATARFMQEVGFVNDYYGADLPAGKKSLAMRITLSSPEHTLTDAEADAAAEAITEQLQSQLGAQLRG